MIVDDTGNALAGIETGKANPSSVHSREANFEELKDSAGSTDNVEQHHVATEATTQDISGNLELNKSEAKAALPTNISSSSQRDQIGHQDTGRASTWEAPAADTSITSTKSTENVESRAEILVAGVSNLKIDNNNDAETPLNDEKKDMQHIKARDIPLAEAPFEPAIAGESDSDSDGWITPSNLARHQQTHSNTSTKPNKSSQTPAVLQAATITSDFALQNTMLLMNLNLLSPSLTRISSLKSHILRCHACFQTCKDMTKQFCPRCGGPTLTRVTCSTSANGEFKLHLKKNMQWNTRGDRYSVPKPVSGTSSGKIGHGGRGKGGKGGWGKELIFAEDQKEYVKAVQTEERQRRRERDLMDDDFLPGILSGNRPSSGRVKVGAGRNVNSRKR